MHSISEVIIPNNDKHHIQKQQQQTTGLIQGLSNNIQLQSICVIVSGKFCFRKCLFAVYKFALHGQQFCCQTGKGNRVNHLQFQQGCYEEDAITCAIQYNFMLVHHWTVMLVYDWLMADGGRIYCNVVLVKSVKCLPNFDCNSFQVKPQQQQLGASQELHLQLF